MSTAPVSLFKAVPSGLDEWLDTYDPQGVVSKSQTGFLSGYYDADKDNIKDANESISFFKEYMGKDGQVYVLILTPKANAGTTGGTQGFDVALKLKGADGSLSAVSANLLSDLDLSPDGFVMTVEALTSLAQSVQDWCKSRVSSAVGKISVTTSGIIDPSANNVGYCGWTTTQLFMDKKTTYTYQYAHQGTISNTHPSAVGGWGGGQVVKTAGSGHLQGDNVYGGSKGWVPGVGADYEAGVAHTVTAYEAYERALAGATEADNKLARTYADGHDDNTGIYENYATNNNLVIKRVSVTIDGKTIDTMGFQVTQNGLTYTFYWDQAAQCNRIGLVTNAAGINVTNQVLSLQSENKFGKTWDAISKAVIWAQEIKGPGGLSTYNADLFSVESKTGSAEASSKAETEALNAFLVKWGVYLSGNRIKAIPDEKDKRKALMDELLTLNPGDLMRLFTGKPGTPGASASGLALLTQLVQSADMSLSQVQTLSESLGKVMYLTGRELARHGAQNSPGSIAMVGFYKAVSSNVSVLVKELSLKVATSGYDQANLRKVLYHLMLGLQNYTGDSVKASGLTPEATLTYLVNKLVEAGGINKPGFTRNAAIELGEFGRSVIGMLASLQGLELVESIPLNEEKGAYFAGLIAIVSNSGSQDSTQRLLVQFFGMLGSHAGSSPEAAKQFQDMQQSSHEDSRKLQDAVVALLMRFIDLLRDASNRMFSRN